MKNQVAEKNHDKTENRDKNEKPIDLPSQLERTTSIDAEPKTLLQEELNLAREEALKVINTYPKEEALKIFLNGLKPVTCPKQPSEDDVVSDDDEEDDYDDYE